MASILFTEHISGGQYDTTIAGAMRDIANGSAEIMRYAQRGADSGMVGLYLPNGKTFWITFMGNSTDPDWTSGWYRITTAGEDTSNHRAIIDDKTLLYLDQRWHTNGNSHGLIAAYLQAYTNEIGENDNYWSEGLRVQY